MNAPAPRIALITGANKGIGFEIARQIGRTGARILLSARNSDPSWSFAHVKIFGYNASKAALNMLTIQLAAELKDAGVKVSAANPGFTATDLNDHRGTQNVAEGAAAAVRLALSPDDGPTGGLFSAGGPEPW